MDREEARARIQRILEGFRKATPTRTGFLGDGKGFALSNMVVDANKGYVYARDSVQSTNHYPVLNRNAVKASFNLPVVLGYTEDEPDIEQVIGIHWASFEHLGNASQLGGVGAHHIQHEFGGGDEVFIDPQLWKPGLAKPTNPASMQVKILPFVYFNQGWQRFPETTTVDLTTYLPANNSRFLLICVDPATNSLVYRAGATFVGASWADYWAGGTTGFSDVPAPSGDEIPLVTMLLTPTTSVIDWNAVTIANMYDMRLHLGIPQDHLTARLDQLEGLTGNERNLPCTGAATVTTDTKKTLPTTKSYMATTQGLGASPDIYVAGYYQAPAADANLDQGGATQTYGDANSSYAAHAFIVVSGAGSVASGQVGIRATGTSINDYGTRTTSDVEVLSTDITTLTANEYLETSKKWLGTVTFELYIVSGTPATYSLDFNYGLCKYDDLGNREFTIMDVEAVGFAGAADTAVDIQLIKHTNTGWTYSAAAFDPVDSSRVIASLSNDHSTDDNLDSSQHFAWKRANLSQLIDGDGSEGFLILVKSTANNAIEYCNIHVGVEI